MYKTSRKNSHTLKRDTRPLQTRLRELGLELGRAELYGDHRDLTNKKRAHASMLKALYRGGR
jgi:hypothetical protein